MSPSSPTRVLGIMSGSSLDGLDLALCAFEHTSGRWTYAIQAMASAPFPAELVERLLHITSATAFDLARTHAELGIFIGEQARDLLARSGGADLVSSHGHTIFHQPALRFTTQVGCGAHIAAITGLPTVVDLRTKDVALGGQGAPLVPIGERDLFTGYDAFLNLGGIANVSFHGGTILGYDVCLCNQALNHLATEAGISYDTEGRMARSGTMQAQLLQTLDAQPFLKLPIPRSMGREHFEQEMRASLDDRSLSLADRLRTTVEHIAMQITSALNDKKAKKVLVTGGGAHNTFLVERIKELAHAEVILPDRRTIDLKEALVFAYLGLLRWRGEANALSSVTGARHDSVGGALYLPN